MFGFLFALIIHAHIARSEDNIPRNGVKSRGLNRVNKVRIQEAYLLLPFILKFSQTWNGPVDGQQNNSV